MEEETKEKTDGETESKTEGETEDQKAFDPDPASNIADQDKEDNNFDAIPVTNISQPKSVYTNQIGDTCHDVGFFYVINHGVKQNTMDGVLKKSKQFFELDAKSKSEASNSK